VESLRIAWKRVDPTVSDRSAPVVQNRTLDFPDVLGEVTTRVTGLHRPTAVSLACCSKSFEEPALNALWKTQKEAMTLIKTLPPDTWILLAPDSRGKRKIVRDLPQLRWRFTLFENPQLKCVLGLDVHSSPVER